MNISGKVALITGSSKRIGRETAIELARRGARVGVHYRSDARGAVETLGQIRKSGGTAEMFHAEITDSAAVKEMFRQLAERFGGLDILVNSASVFHPGIAAETTAEQWDEQMDSNAKAPFFIAQLAAGLMKSR